MKKYSLVFLVAIICIFSFGCQKSNEANVVNTIEDIEASLNEAGYEIIDDKYDGLYDPGEKVLQVWILMEDGSKTNMDIISYKDEDYAKKTCKQIEKDGFYEYIRENNIVGIYSKDIYENADEILKKILDCNPIDYKSAVLKLK